ncbi:transketolase family protein [Chloroflexota bacterium]
MTDPIVVSEPGVVDPGCRDAFGKALSELGRENENVVALVADCLDSVRCSIFDRSTERRTYDFGIAEGNMVGFAAGMAAVGKIPYAVTYAAMITMRACEQVRTDVAYPGFNVKLVGTHSGLSFETGGATHHSTEDIGIMRTLANMTVVAPADSIETVEATFAIADYPGPVYMRIGRDDEPLVYEGESFEFVIGRANTLRPGGDVSLIAAGTAVHLALEAAKLLEARGVEARVLNMHTIKPIDREAIVRAASETGAVVTVEEHNIIGGLGSAVAEVLGEEKPTPLQRVGVPDCYCGTGYHDELREKIGLTPPKIAEAAEAAIQRKE